MVIIMFYVARMLASDSKLFLVPLRLGQLHLPASFPGRFQSGMRWTRRQDRAWC